MTTKPAKHSPAPWEIAQYENWKGFSIWASGAGCIAERWYASEHEDAPILANARLIAAAPALIEALELVRMSLGWQYLSTESKLVIDNAIRLAEVGAQGENTQ